MSATMKQGLAALLVRKTNAARNKGAGLLFNVRKDLGASATHAEHKLYSDLIGLVEKHICNADKLLHKRDASYFDCLDALNNLERLLDVTRQIGSLANLYARRQQLEKQVTQGEKRQRKCEAKTKSLPNIQLPTRGSFLGLMPLALLIGYFIVGGMVFSKINQIDPERTFDKYFGLLAWPIGIGVSALGGLRSEELAEIRSIIRLGLIPPAIALVLGSVISMINRINKARYGKVQRKRQQLSDDLPALSKEVSSARNSVYTVDREISGYRNKIAQHIKDIKWKPD